MATGMFLLEGRFKHLTNILCALEVVSDDAADFLDEEDEGAKAGALRGLLKGVIEEVDEMAREVKIVLRLPQRPEPTMLGVVQ